MNRSIKLLTLLVIATTLFLVSSSLPALCAQKAYLETDNTLTTVSFSTSNGVIRLNLPDQIAQGETISGIIQIEANGTSASARERYEKKLNDYIVLIGSHEAYVRIGNYRLTVPKEASTLSISLTNKRGSTLASENVSVISQPAKRDPGPYKVAQCVGANKPIKISGEFTGDTRLSKVTVNSRPGLILAESPNSLVFQSPDNIVGAMKVTLLEGTQKYEGEINALSVTTSMVTRSIERGKSHSLLVRLQGLKTGGPSVMVKVTNQSPNVVNLEGGEVQSIGAKSDTGTWEIRREVLGQRSGTFSISATLMPSAEQIELRAI